MPKVGKKHYPYTHAGKRAAKEAAKKQGLKVEYTENISQLSIILGSSLLIPIIETFSLPLIFNFSILYYP